LKTAIQSSCHSCQHVICELKLSKNCRIDSSAIVYIQCSETVNHSSLCKPPYIRVHLHLKAVNKGPNCNCIIATFHIYSKYQNYILILLNNGKNGYTLTVSLYFDINNRILSKKAPHLHTNFSDIYIELAWLTTLLNIFRLFSTVLPWTVTCKTIGNRIVNLIMNIYLIVDLCSIDNCISNALGLMLYN
jgi:hypothetical protein